MYFEFEKKFNFKQTMSGEIKPGYLLQNSSGFVYEVVDIVKETQKTITFTYRELIFYTNGGVISEKINRQTKHKNSLIRYACVNAGDIKRVWDYFYRVPSKTN